jgi:hypothetical protein
MDDGARKEQNVPVAHLVVERRNDPTAKPRRPHLNLVAGHVGLEDLSQCEAERRTGQMGVEVRARVFMAYAPINSRGDPAYA